MAFCYNDLITDLRCLMEKAASEFEVQTLSHLQAKIRAANDQVLLVEANCTDQATQKAAASVLESLNRLQGKVSEGRKASAQAIRLAYEGVGNSVFPKKMGQAATQIETALKLWDGRVEESQSSPQNKIVKLFFNYSGKSAIGLGMLIFLAPGVFKLSRRAGRMVGAAAMAGGAICEIARFSSLRRRRPVARRGNNDPLSSKPEIGRARPTAADPSENRETPPSWQGDTLTYHL
jgi:hypothetical protein